MCKEGTSVDALERLKAGNRLYLAEGKNALRERTAKEGQHPYAIVVCCSDSRVIPERIFSVDIGDLFVIRVAGNVLDRHQLGSIEYAAEHLHCPLVLILGHTGCGAVAAALSCRLHHGGYPKSDRHGDRSGRRVPEKRPVRRQNGTGGVLRHGSCGPRRGIRHRIRRSRMVIPPGFVTFICDDDSEQTELRSIG